MSAHTPGPWKYGVRRDGSIWLSLGDHKTGPHYQGDLCATEADARVIVAAPDLLTAAIEAYDAMQSIWNTKAHDDDFIYDEMGSELSSGFFSLRAAIAKAKGQP